MLLSFCAFIKTLIYIPCSQYTFFDASKSYNSKYNIGCVLLCRMSLWSSCPWSNEKSFHYNKGNKTKVFRGNNHWNITTLYVVGQEKALSWRIDQLSMKLHSTFAAHEAFLILQNFCRMIQLKSFYNTPQVAKNWTQHVLLLTALYNSTESVGMDMRETSRNLIFLYMDLMI